MLEAIAGRELDWTYTEQNRIGDDMWWISDLAKFQAHYPTWPLRYDIDGILQEIHDIGQDRWNNSD